MNNNNKKNLKFFPSESVGEKRDTDESVLFLELKVLLHRLIIGPPPFPNSTINARPSCGAVHQLG